MCLMWQRIRATSVHLIPGNWAPSGSIRASKSECVDVYGLLCGTYLRIYGYVEYQNNLPYAPICISDYLSDFCECACFLWGRGTLKIYLFIYLIFDLCIFETASHHVALAVLVLTMRPRLALNSQRILLSVPPEN